MAKPRLRPEAHGTRFEYRVWGRQRRARKVLAAGADHQLFEQVDDCYLLVDDSSWNAKIRNNTLEIKRLVSERKGFEQWASEHHRTARTVPMPFDRIFEHLRLGHSEPGQEDDLSVRIATFEPTADIRPVFVTKHRRRYRLGALRAESTDLTIHESGDVLHTLSIEGESLDELVALRRRLGLRGDANIAIHNALDLELVA
jgi:hypothetical protein